MRTNQKHGQKEEITVPVPISLLKRVRARAKDDKLSLNLAVVQALEMVYGEKQGEEQQ